MNEPRVVTDVTDAHYDLLLDADPNIHFIHYYLDKGTLFEWIENDKLLGVAIVQQLYPNTLEIKNIAVSSNLRGKGLGRTFLQQLTVYAKQQGFIWLEIGTGSTSVGQLHLYQSEGFIITGVDAGFFTRHYDSPIIENGITLTDMIRLRKQI